MRKLLVTLSILAIIGGLAFGGATLYKNTFAQKPAPTAPPSSTKSSAVAQPQPSDPTQHDTFDIEFAKKLVLYNELAAQLDDYAKNNATQPAIREFAARKSASSTSQANAYAAMLDSWGAEYSRLNDFPKVAGGACSGYPTFPGMLPHDDVNTFLRSSANEVDRQYLALMTKHHSGINQTIKAVGSFVIYGELIVMRDAFFASQDAETKQLQEMQKQYGYA